MSCRLSFLQHQGNRIAYHVEALVVPSCIKGARSVTSVVVTAKQRDCHEPTQIKPLLFYSLSSSKHSQPIMSMPYAILKAKIATAKEYDLDLSGKTVMITGAVCEIGIVSHKT